MQFFIIEYFDLEAKTAKDESDDSEEETEKIVSRKRKDSNTSSPPPSKRKMINQLVDNEDIPLVDNKKQKLYWLPDGNKVE